VFGNVNYLLQYDLTALDIPASCDTLDETIYKPYDGGAVRRAPDGKIYYTQMYVPQQGVPNYPWADSIRNTINENLGVVNDPDVVGNGCNFQPLSFYLGGKRTYYGLPNNPDYNLGPVAGSICDSLSTGVNNFFAAAPKLYVFYNSLLKSAFVNGQNIRGGCQISVYDLNGRQIFSRKIEPTSVYMTTTFDCSMLSSGMYMVIVQSKYDRVAAKFVKE
jgi:hypothetical protein